MSQTATHWQAVAHRQRRQLDFLKIFSIFEKITKKLQKSAVS
jgi:hypothetical protein